MAYSMPMPEIFSFDGMLLVGRIITATVNTFIALILILDRAVATRLMFDSRRVFGALILICGWSQAIAGLTAFFPLRWLEAAIVSAADGLSVSVALMTLIAYLPRRVRPR